jgi:hypothetical protein
MASHHGFVAACMRFDTPPDAGDNPGRPPSAPRQDRRDFALDDRLHHMLRDLRRALSEAISESSEVSRTLRKIREEGYSLYLLVDCKREREGDDDPLPVAAPRRSGGEPVFQINGNDLSFLRSIGIDPTRRLRRRRPVPDPIP